MRVALERQYHFGLEMLRQCIQRCPDELWESGTHPRNFWRIAYHAIYFTDRYLQPSARKFKPWAKHVKDVQALWGMPSIEPPYTKLELIEYLNQVDQGVQHSLAQLDLESLDSGFSLYKMPKFDLLMLNLRHLQHHIGQLTELLMTEGIDIEWAGMN